MQAKTWPACAGGWVGVRWSEGRRALVGRQACAGLKAGVRWSGGRACAGREAGGDAGGWANGQGWRSRQRPAGTLAGGQTDRGGGRGKGRRGTGCQEKDKTARRVPATELAGTVFARTGRRTVRRGAPRRVTVVPSGHQGSSASVIAGKAKSRTTRTRSEATKKVTAL